MIIQTTYHLDKTEIEIAIAEYVARQGNISHNNEYKTDITITDSDRGYIVTASVTIEMDE